MQNASCKSPTFQQRQELLSHAVCRYGGGATEVSKSRHFPYTTSCWTTRPSPTGISATWRTSTRMQHSVNMLRARSLPLSVKVKALRTRHSQHSARSTERGRDNTRREVSYGSAADLPQLVGVGMCYIRKYGSFTWQSECRRDLGPEKQIGTGLVELRTPRVKPNSCATSVQPPSHQLSIAVIRSAILIVAKLEKVSDTA
jgi:hypothetical protein